MDPHHYEYSYEELMTEGQYETPPVPPDSRRHAVWLAARARWPTVADARRAAAADAAAAAAAANAPSNSSNNNNNDDDDDNDWAGPATAEPQGLIDPALAGFPAVAAPAPAPAPLPAPLPAPPAPAPAAAPGPAHPQPVVSAELQAILDAAVLGPRRAWTNLEDDYLRDARLAENSFAAIGNTLKRTGAACETRAKGRWYKGGKKPGDK